MSLRALSTHVVGRKKVGTGVWEGDREGGGGGGRGYSVKTSLVFVFLCPCQAGECHVTVYGENCLLLLATPFLFSL